MGISDCDYPKTGIAFHLYRLWKSQLRWLLILFNAFFRSMVYLKKRFTIEQLNMNIGLGSSYFTQDYSGTTLLL